MIFRKKFYPSTVVGTGENMNQVESIENEIRVWSFQNFGNGLALGLTRFMGKFLLALALFLIGRFIIKKLGHILPKTPISAKIDPTVRNFFFRAIVLCLYLILGISCVSIASVITLLASAGVAVGLALQGSLSNLAGGIMLLLFRPFKVGNYIKSGTDEGTVQEVSIFYTVILSPDNKRISIPNGSLMNANIINYSAECFRRVDLIYQLGRDEDVEKIKGYLESCIQDDELIRKYPEPFVGLTAVGRDYLEFSIRLWVDTPSYWTLYNRINEKVAIKFAKENVLLPSTAIKNIQS